MYIHQILIMLYHHMNTLSNSCRWIEIIANSHWVLSVIILPCPMKRINVYHSKHCLLYSSSVRICLRYYVNTSVCLLYVSSSHSVFWTFGVLTRNLESVWAIATAKSTSLNNSSSSGQNGRRFPDDILKCIFLSELYCILFRISLNFAPKGPLDNNPALV